MPSPRIQRRFAGLVVAPFIGLLLAASLAMGVACSRSTEDAENRGLVVDREVAAPTSPREMGESEAARRAQEEAEQKRAERERFDEAEKGAVDPGA